jgi:threonine/homoserine/homoserine lactone efflux protein
VGTLLAETLPLALGAAVSPVLFLLQLTTMTGPRPLARGTALALGAAVPLAIMSAVAVSVGTASGSLRHDETIKAALDLSFGVLLLLLAIRTALRRPAKTHTRGSGHEPSLRRSFLLGVAGMATNASTIVLYLAALKLIAASRVGDVAKVGVTVVVFAIAMAVVLVPLALTAIAPGPSGRVLASTGAWMSAHRRAIGIVLLVVFGTWLTAKGARAL